MIKFLYIVTAYKIVKVSIVITVTIFGNLAIIKIQKGRICK